MCLGGCLLCDIVVLHPAFSILFKYRHDGLIIMATNRPYDLDEAMHRRIMIAMEFYQPDHILRKSIWENHIPEQMKLADDVDMVRTNHINIHHEINFPNIF